MTPRQESLLELDPGLGRLLPAARRKDADRQLIVRTHRLATGPWDGERLRGAGPEHIGLLLANGLIAREIVLSDTVSCELLGRGDVMRPWSAEDPARLLRAEVRWSVLVPADVAVLDRRFAAQLSLFPEVGEELVDRFSQQVQRLSLTQAIGQLNGVDRRLTMLFWHLAERWGRSTPEGVTMTLPLPHRLLANLVGARRPTVSAALSELSHRGILVRDGERWLLTGPRPAGLEVRPGTAPGTWRARDEQPGDGALDALPDALPVTGRIAEIHETLRGLHERFEASAGDARALRESTADLYERIGTARRRREAARAARGAVTSAGGRAPRGA